MTSPFPFSVTKAGKQNIGQSLLSFSRVYLVSPSSVYRWTLPRLEGRNKPTTMSPFSAKHTPMGNQSLVDITFLVMTSSSKRVLIKRLFFPSVKTSSPCLLAARPQISILTSRRSSVCPLPSSWMICGRLHTHTVPSELQHKCCKLSHDISVIKDGVTC